VILFEGFQIRQQVVLLQPPQLEEVAGRRLREARLEKAG
jgi:hypothetical protein